MTFNQNHAPKLFLIDVRLPDIGDFDICEKFYEEGNRGPSPILAARDQELDKVLGLEIGMEMMKLVN